MTSQTLYRETLPMRPRGEVVPSLREALPMRPRGGVVRSLREAPR